MKPRYLKTRHVPRPNIHSTNYSTRPSFVFCHLRTVIGTSCFTVRGFGLWTSLPSLLRKASTFGRRMRRVAHMDWLLRYDLNNIVSDQRRILVVLHLSK